MGTVTKGFDARLANIHRFANLSTQVFTLPENLYFTTYFNDPGTAISYVSVCCLNGQ